MKIGHCDLDKQVFVIAEIGNNHEGRFDVAERLVREAAACGVDAVKFQTFLAEEFVSPADPARFKRLQSFQLTGDQFGRLAELARSLGLVFMSTPLDMTSVGVLRNMVDAFKVASGDNTFYPMMAEIARIGKPMIISLGLADMAQAERSVRFVLDLEGARVTPDMLAVTHCVSAYPTQPEQANLRSIPYLQSRLPCLVGYSDHTVGIDAATAAVALGARLVEKHFTLDNNFSDFRDHKLSANPADMRELVSRIRRIPAMLGREEKSVQPDEKPGLQLFRRSIAVRRALPKGHRLAMEDLVWLRPGGGIAPGDEAQVVGRALAVDVEAGRFLSLSDMERKG